MSALVVCPDCGYAGGRHSRLCPHYRGRPVAVGVKPPPFVPKPSVVESLRVPIRREPEKVMEAREALSAAIDLSLHLWAQKGRVESRGYSSARIREKLKMAREQERRAKEDLNRVLYAYQGEPHA